MLQKINLVGVLLIAYISTAQQLPDLGQPPATAQLFGEQIISTGLYERDFALSPDGKEIFYTLQAPQGGFQTNFTFNKIARWKMEQTFGSLFCWQV